MRGDKPPLTQYAFMALCSLPYLVKRAHKMFGVSSDEQSDSACKDVNVCRGQRIIAIAKCV